MPKDITKMTSNEIRLFIRNQMLDAGYSEEQIKYFLAGATLLGYLADNRASWARAFLTRRHFENLHAFDYHIERAGATHINYELWQSLDDQEQASEQERIAASRRAEQAKELALKRFKGK
jgi:hypothetical protein